jgi:hypothetical protein
MKGNEYISITLLLMSADTSSMQIMKSHAAISLLAVVVGFLVEITSPAKKDWDIPIYNTGSIFILVIYDKFQSKIAKSQQILGIFETDGNCCSRLFFSG